eukprot:gene247-biopygen5743
MRQARPRRRREAGKTAASGEDIGVFAHSRHCALLSGTVRAGLGACPACGGLRKVAGGGEAAPPSPAAPRLCRRCGEWVDAGGWRSHRAKCANQSRSSGGLRRAYVSHTRQEPF